MNMIKLFRAALFPVLMSTMLTACGSDVPNQLTGAAVDAQVLDAVTKQPIEGAIVLLTWSSMPKRSIWGFDGHSSGSDICYHAETAVSDAQGRYHTEPWSRMPPFPNMPNGDFRAVAYKRGYVQIRASGTDHVTPISDPNYHITPTILMKPFTGTLDQRFEDLHRMHPYCNNVEPSSKRNFHPLVKAIYEEMVQTAETKEQRETYLPIAKRRLDELPNR